MNQLHGTFSQRYSNYPPPPIPAPFPKTFFKKEFYWYNDTNKTQMKMYIPILIKGSVV